ncbi:hypothetical protein Taro_039876 [Colocasia esculenta]|uniref:DUF7722 domain-containing protein n=1 Tax=Colocasia esculenta TaxID=4460 RepID=A0A843WNI9_COLES|nr:hypothetical protein [Colocasia esculenta]
MAPGLSLVQTAANGIVRALGSSGRREGDGLHGTTRCSREEGEAYSRQLRAPRSCISGFQMPLHYPRYKREDYEKMEGWKLDVLLREYGLSFDGSLHDKRAYAMGTFLWPDQL